MAGRKKLVIGASGFLGSHVPWALVERGDDVFHCAVDTRGWLRDPAPLFRTNVDGLRHVLDAAADADLHRFVFTSSLVTIGICDDRPATEDDAIRRAAIFFTEQRRDR
jgi:dihydroflavonol-4-reductase